MIDKIYTHDGSKWVEGVPAGTVANWRTYKWQVSSGLHGLILALFPDSGDQDRCLTDLVGAGIVQRKELCLGGGMAINPGDGSGKVSWTATHLIGLLGYDRPDPPMDQDILDEVKAELLRQQLL